MKTPVVILGCGGLGREIAAVLGRSGQYTPAGFYDDGAPVGASVLGLPVLGPIAALEAVDTETAVVFGIANTEVKERIWNRLRTNHHIHFPTVVSEQAMVLAREHVELGAGTVVMPGAIISPDVTTGIGCLIHMGCILSHDTHLGDFCSVLQGVVVPSGISLGNKELVRAGKVF